MRLLSWDTSSKAGAIAALEWDEGSRAGWRGVRVVAEWSLNVDLTHSDRLLWGIHQTLEAARWKLAEVDYLGVGQGPGSFTGLRVGITTARTLGSTLKKPVVGVSSLAALARPAALWLAGRERGIVIASSDAAKGELFAFWGAARAVADCAAKASGDLPGHWKRGVEEEVLGPAALARVLKRRFTGPQAAKAWIAVGEGRKRYPELWAALPAKLEIEPPMPAMDQVQGRYVGLLAWEAIQAGLARPALQLQPRYLRASDAEVKLRAGLLKRAPTEGNA